MKRTCCVILLHLTLVTSAWAQMDAASLRVLVEDQSHAVVPGADVRLINESTNVELLRTSNEAGYSSFTPLVRGTYTIVVSMPGFLGVKMNSVVLDVNE